MDHRKLFYDICMGRKPKEVAFVPDITDWYLGQHRNKGQALKYAPGVYIPDDDDIKYEKGIGIPKEYLGLSLKDIYEKYDWGMHAHIRNWYEEYYTDKIQYEEVINENYKHIKYITQLGELTRDFKLAADGSWGSINYLLKDFSDIKILFEVLRETRFKLRDDNIMDTLKAIGNRGQGDIVVNRSPFGKLLHEYLGFENTTYLLFDDVKLYKEYEKIQTQKDMELIELACKSSCNLVLICDHADATLFTPQWYEEYCIPFYKKAGEKLHRAEKFISTHVDGNLKNLLPLVKKTGFDILDGCTPAPAFDYEIEDLAAALGESMIAFVGVPFSMFCDETTNKEIQNYADRIINAFQGRAILNVGDILPVNGDIYKVISLGEYLKNRK